MNQRKNRRGGVFSRDTLRDLGVTLGMTAAAYGLSYLLNRWTGSFYNVTAVYTLAVMIVARLTDGYGWGIFASVLGVISVNYAFAAPYYRLNFSMSGYPVVFASLLVISVITSAATDNIKRQANRARSSEQRTQKLYDFSQQLANAHEEEKLIELGLRYLNDLLRRPVLYLHGADSEARVCGGSGAPVSGPPEKDAIHQCFALREVTGAGMPYRPYAEFRYFPLRSEETMLGCIGIEWKDIPKDEALSEHIHAVLAQIGLSLERLRLSEERNRAALLAEHEKIRSNLLRSISHDLRTPLTGIIGASAVIQDSGDRLGGAEIRRLAADINEDAQWLLHMVENLLSVTRVSEGASLKKTEEPAEEVIAEAVARCKKRFPEAQIRIQLPKEMIFVPMDVTLIVQVLINLLENAIRYAETPVDLSVRQERGSAVFTVRDFGPGIDEGTRGTLFQATQTPDRRRGGLGIGLTLCRSIVMAHGGTISGSNHPDGGAQFILTLPLEETHE